MVRTSLSFLLFCLVFISGYGQVPNGKIIFISGKNDHYDLYAINNDGSDERQLTNINKSINAFHILHNRIVYSQQEDSGKDYSILMTGINGHIKPLIKNKEACFPRWKPDGKLIAYENYPDNRQEIWVMDSNGANQRLLIANARHPYWSADNKKIVFTRNYEVYIRDLVRGTERQLTHLTSKNITTKWPALSPDNRQVTFVAFHDEKVGIYILDLKTGHQKIIENCSMPYWTDDPKYFVCSCYVPKSKNQQIAMINVETGEKTFITHNNRRNDAPVWLPLSSR